MSQIPTDLDTTMWDIAERADSQAAADFSERFPALAEDMRTRMGLVAGMKGVRKAIAPAFVPAFTPRYMSKPKPKWIRYGPAALSLAALAGASFYVTQNLLTPLPDPSIFRTVAPPTNQPPDRQVDLAPAASLGPNPDNDTPKPYSANGAHAADDSSPARLVRIQMSDVHLVNAIQAIGHRFHCTVQVAKDFPDPVIDVDLTGSDVMTFMNQLANSHNFTAYDEGDGKVLVVPVRGE